MQTSLIFTAHLRSLRMHGLPKWWRLLIRCNIVASPMR